MADAIVKVMTNRAVVQVAGADLLAPLITSAATAAATAETAAERAELAESGAVAAAGGLYQDTAAGLAATADGQFFAVVGDGASTYAILYLNDAGVAVEQARYASQTALQQALNERPTLSALAEPAGAATVGEASGGTVQQAIDRLVTDDIVSQSVLPPPARPCALISRGGGIMLYSPHNVLGFWEEHTLESSTGAELRPTTRRVVQFADIYHVIYDDFTLDGTWANDVLTETVLGGVVKASVTVGTYVEKEITLDGATNLIEFIYGARSAANHISVTINGGTALVNMLPTNDAGEKYIDAYDPSSTLVPSQRALIAVLPAGTYTIRATLSAEKNAAAATSKQFYPNGLSAVGGQAGLPGGARTHAPQWTTGEDVSPGYQRYNAGITYRATTAGTTGDTAPTHTSGTVSDGGVSWIPVVQNGYQLFAEPYLTDVSEPFYAIWLALNGQPEDDFGGDIHANQTRQSSTIYANGREVSVSDGVPVYGETIRVRQFTNGWHTSDPDTTVVTFTTDYTAMAGGVFRYDTEMDPLYSGQLGLFYPAMMPLYAYMPGNKFRYMARLCQVPSLPPVRPLAYAGQANPDYGNLQALQLAALIQLGSAAGAGGVPATGTSGTMTLACSIETDRASVNGFARPGAGAYWDMNTTGVDATAGGYSGHAVKAYFRHGLGDTKVAIAAGQKMRWGATYRSTLFDGRQAGEP